MKPGKLQPGTLVVVKWYDAYAMRVNWQSPKTAANTELPVVTTVGLVAKHTKKRLTLFQSFYDAQVGGVFLIPAGCIKSIKRLGKPQKKAKRE